MTSASLFILPYTIVGLCHLALRKVATTVLSSPTSVSEVAQDGLIRRRWVDAQLAEMLGDITATEVNQVADEEFQVRHGRRRGADLTFAATRVARVTAEGWEWTSSRMQEAAEVFGIPELWGTHPEQLDFQGAVRTLHDGAPVLRALGSILVVHVPVPAGNALLGAAGIGGRPLDGYCAMHGMPEVTCRDGVVYDLPTGLLLDDLRADAAFLSHEHQLLFDAIVPPHPGILDLSRGIAHFQTPRGPLTATAQVIATVTDNKWTWAWADPYLPPRSAFALHEFGASNALPILCTPRLPLNVAQKWDAEKIAKPILGVWTHAFIPLNPQTYAVTLLSHPSLALPAPRPAVVQQVVATPLDPVVPRERALGFYCAARRLRREDIPS